MADVKKMKENEVNTEEKIEPKETETKKEETKMEKTENSKAKKFLDGTLKVAKSVGKFALMAGGGTLIGLATLRAAKKPVYVELPAGKVPQIDAHEGVDFVPAPDTEVQEA